MNTHLETLILALEISLWSTCKLRNQKSNQEPKFKKKLQLLILSVFFLYQINAKKRVSVQEVIVSPIISRNKNVSLLLQWYYIYSRPELWNSAIFLFQSLEDFMIEAIFRLKWTILASETKQFGKFLVKSLVIPLILDYHHYLPIFFDGIRE